VGIINTGFNRLLLIACAVSSILSFPIQAADNGVIGLKRDVQPGAVGRPALQKDPYPTTVNANPSARVIQMTNNTELSDGDFAGVSSGSTISRTIMQDGSGMTGLNVVTNPNGMPGMSAGHGGGSGNAISGTINRSISAGLSPLSNISTGK
jgi:hypothetical protein